MDMNYLDGRHKFFVDFNKSPKNFAFHGDFCKLSWNFAAF